MAPTNPRRRERATICALASPPLVEEACRLAIRESALRSPPRAQSMSFAIASLVDCRIASPTGPSETNRA